MEDSISKYIRRWTTPTFTVLRRLQQLGLLSISSTTKLVPKQLKTKVRYDTRVVEQDSRYTCDFFYKEDGKIIVEEFKSEQTSKLPDYVLRRKLMIKKIYKHNERKGRTPWVFREVIYYFDKNKQTTIEDK